MKSKKGKPVGELVDSWNYVRHVSLIFALSHWRLDL
jgi:hypothetical protein